MTGRRLITSALRSVGAIGAGQQPTHSMFADGLEALNMLLEAWSADELLPYEFTQYDFPLIGGRMCYTIGDGAEWDSDSICNAQTASAGGSQSLTMNGVYVSGGVATLDVPRKLIVVSEGDDSGRTFTVTGTGIYGESLVEAIAGVDDGIAYGDSRFKTITSVVVDGNTAARVSVGTDYMIAIRRPHHVLDGFVRDTDGIDEIVFPTDRQRYNEIEDKDEAGMPTKQYFRRSHKSGEIYLHPIPATGAEMGVEMRDGGAEVITNGGFTGNANGWTLGDGWTYGDNAVSFTTELCTDPNLTIDGTGGWSRTPTTPVGWTFNNPGYTFNNPGVSFSGRTEITIPSALQAGVTYSFTIRSVCPSCNASQSELNIIVITGVTVKVLHHLVYHAASWDIDGSFEVTMPSDLSTSNQKMGINLFNRLYTNAQITHFSCKKTGAFDYPLTQPNANLALDFDGGDYDMTFDLSGVTGGSLAVDVSGNTSEYDSDGTKSLSLRKVTSGSDVTFAASGDFVGTLDNVSVVVAGNKDTLDETNKQYSMYFDGWMPFRTVGADEIDNDINLPGEYLLALKWGLASELLPEYGRNASQYISERARMYTDVLRRINTRVPKPTILWPVLPMLDGQPAVNTG